MRYATLALAITGASALPKSGLPVKEVLPLGGIFDNLKGNGFAAIGNILEGSAKSLNVIASTISTLSLPHSHFLYKLSNQT